MVSPTYDLPHIGLLSYVDDGLHHAIAIVGDKVESLLALGKREMVSHNLIEVDSAAGDQLDCGGHALVAASPDGRRIVPAV